MRSKNQPADICLVLEGTYPYVSGGVSTWVHQIISAFPDLTFALFYLGAQRDPGAKYKYELPANVIHIEEAYLFDAESSFVALRKKVPASWQPFYAALRKLCVRAPSGDPHDLELLRGILDHVAKHTTVSFDTFWQDRETWAVIREVYDRYTPEDSFLDFYWTCCFLIQPLWKLARAMPRMPKARLYHTACTGYAGLAAALAAEQHDAPMILTEHGIYLRERIADICKSRWIPETMRARPSLSEPLSHLRQLWIGCFEVLGRICYHRANVIASLFEKNADAQKHFGADPARITIIPNGIRTEDCAPALQQRAARRERNPESKVVGFLGRVVSIKDVKTLLHTARKVCDRLPDARFLIAGPAEEEPEYVDECIALSAQLELNRHVEFLGPVNAMKFLPDLDLMILTSVSEGLPFVILEALAAGVPVVSTDVGACADILAGRPAENIPACGLIAEIGNADALAAACVRLLTDPALLDAMSLAGRDLATRYYHEKTILAAYRALYENLTTQSSPQLAAAA